MREFRPVPDPSGSLQPPNRRPPTAVGAETPEPEPRPSPTSPRRGRRRRGRLAALLESTLAIPRGLLRVARRVARSRARA